MVFACCSQKERYPKGGQTYVSLALIAYFHETMRRHLLFVRHVGQFSTPTNPMYLNLLICALIHPFFDIVMPSWLMI